MQYWWGGGGLAVVERRKGRGELPKNPNLRHVWVRLWGVEGGLGAKGKEGGWVGWGGSAHI